MVEKPSVASPLSTVYLASAYSYSAWLPTVNSDRLSPQNGERDAHPYLNPDKLEDKDLHKYARQVGLDLGRFDHEMSINLYAGEILRNLEFSINHGITGTPTFFVNDALWAVTGVKLIEAVKALAEG